MTNEHKVIIDYLKKNKASKDAIKRVNEAILSMQSDGIVSTHNFVGPFGSVFKDAVPNLAAQLGLNKHELIELMMNRNLKTAYTLQAFIKTLK